MLFLYLSMYWFTLSDSKKIRKTIDKIIQGVIDRDIVLEIRKPQVICYFRNVSRYNKRLACGNFWLFF